MILKSEYNGVEYIWFEKEGAAWLIKRFHLPYEGERFVWRGNATDPSSLAKIASVPLEVLLDLSVKRLSAA